MALPRFRLRSAFVATALGAVIVACMSGAWKWHDRIYYPQVRMVNAALAKHPEIAELWVVTNNDVELEVEQMFFSTVDKPDEFFAAYGPDARTDQDFLEGFEQSLLERRPAAIPSYAERWRY